MQIPTIVVNDGTVLDVTFTKWESNEDGTEWSITGESKMPPSAREATHFVFELPIGCFMVDLARTGLYGSGDITIGPAGFGVGLKVEQCTIPRQLRQELIAETEQPTFA